MSMTFTDALIIAANAHDGVNDAGGVEYIKHPLHVYHILKMKGVSNETLMIGLLHDVVEDNPKFSIDYLRTQGASEAMLTALELLTHVKDHEYIELKTAEFISYGIDDEFAVIRGKEEEYYRYIKRLSINDIAREVKLADIEHNSDIRRVPPKQLENADTAEYVGRRVIKYAHARNILSGGRVGY